MGTKTFKIRTCMRGFKNIGWLFNDTEPYEWIDKVDEYIYNKVKDELLS